MLYCCLSKLSTKLLNYMSKLAMLYRNTRCQITRIASDSGDNFFADRLPRLRYPLVLTEQPPTRVAQGVQHFSRNIKLCFFGLLFSLLKSRVFGPYLLLYLML